MGLPLSSPGRLAGDGNRYVTLTELWVRIHPAVQFFALGECLGELTTLTEAAAGAANAGRVLPTGTRHKLDEMLSKLFKSEPFIQHFPYSVKTAERMLEALKDPEVRQWKMSEMLRELCTRIQDEMGEGLYVEIEPRYIPLCMEPGRDWANVQCVFADAATDILQSSQCIAFERYTAAVFHLMRVLEHGLRDMAQRFGIKFDDRTWHPIIRDIETAIHSRKKDPKKLTEEERDNLSFYSDAAVEFKYFKDAWRNHVSHAKSAYDAGQAESIYTHVRDFMQKLATRPRPAAPSSPSETSEP